jgi:gliding motility-associated lipoprotein GldH
MRYKISKILFFLIINTLIAVGFTACDKDFLLDKKIEISQKGWAYKDTLNFDFDIKDTMKIYNLYLEIEHGELYPYQNLYVMTHTRFPNGIRAAQRINIDLAQKTGKWLGKNSGNTFTHRVDLQEGAYFNEAGNYTLTLAQHMRNDSLADIKSIRFVMEQTTQTRDKVELKKERKPQEKQKKYLVE